MTLMNSPLWYLQVSVRKYNSLGLFAPVGITVAANSRADADKAAIKEFGLSGYEVQYVINVKEIGTEQ